MKRVISMRCTQEQFDSIKDRIPKSYPIEGISDFKRYHYLTNYCGKKKVVSNITFKRNEHYKKFNADIFLEACGVKVEKVWKGSELQMRYNNGDWFDVGIYEFRLKPKPDYSQEIEALQQKAKENGMKVTINFEKL